MIESLHRGTAGLDRVRSARGVSRLTGEQEWRYGLTHRDLDPDNVVLGDNGHVVLFDWGTAQAGPTPWLDAAQVLRAHLKNNRPTADELAAFLDGAGLPTAIDEVSRGLRESERRTVVDFLQRVNDVVEAYRATAPPTRR